MRNYKDGRICLQCKTPITFGSKSGCCKSCGAKRKIKKKPRQTLCGFCNKEITTYPSRVNKKFCSLKCRAEFQKIHPVSYWQGKKMECIRGEKHWNWKGVERKRGFHSVSRSEYKYWRTAVFARDSYKCRINNNECKGQFIQAHHILNWVDYPELRYEINNGITLCLAHHPRGRANEKRLIPIFQELVSVSK